MQEPGEENRFGPNSLDKERSLLNDDPKWLDTTYVLANYKTEPCKKPPRLCRQGYACPQFHNNKDRRRSPRKYKYRSTPCPAVKTADEWGDPVNCDTGDNCQYCHTRYPHSHLIWSPKNSLAPASHLNSNFAGLSSSSTQRFTSRQSVTTSRTRAIARGAPSVHLPIKNVSMLLVSPPKHHSLSGAWLSRHQPIRKPRLDLITLRQTAP